MNKFLESVNFRHACKLFDENKKIPQESFEEILEVGRLAPSSFGMEPTRLLVVRSDEAKKHCVHCVGTSHKLQLRVK